MSVHKSLSGHLLRGTIGITLFLIAFYLGTAHFLLAVLLALGGMTAFGGCPLCWTMGLIEKLSNLKKG